MVSRRAVVLLLVLATAACGADDAAGQPDAAPAREPAEGGSLLLVECGYAVTTRVGMTEPKLIAAGSTTLGPDPAPRQVHLGLAGDPARSMVVSWRTRDDVTKATTLRFGKAAVAERSQDGVSFEYVTGFNGPRARMHEVHLCGLDPDTTYRYQVGGEGAWSEEHTFRTAPDAADPSAQATVVVLGDSRAAQDVWGTVINKAMEIASPDLILFTGDAVTLGQLQAEWDAFYDAVPALAGVPLVLAHGNHELNSNAYYAMNAMPGNEGWFGLDYGPLHLTVLNDSPEDDAAIATVERDFLRQDLADHAAAPWKLLMHHKSMWSSAVAHGSDEALRGVWGPVVDEAQVDLVLAGHDHDYERTKPLRGTSVVERGTVFMVVGGAGATLYDNGSSYFTAISAKTECFAVLNVRRGALEARAYRGDGMPLDNFTLAKP